MIKEQLQERIRASREYFERSTRPLTEEHSGFAPKEGMMTAAQQVAHAAQTVEWFVNGAFNPAGFDLDFEKATGETMQVTSLAAAREWMARAYDNALAVVASKDEADLLAPLPENPIFGPAPRWTALWSIEEHSAHHRGSLAVYVRMLGAVPPMPYMDVP
jgi:uncharacterized damage-inducible protein DinB